MKTPDLIFRQRTDAVVIRRIGTLLNDQDQVYDGCSCGDIWVSGVAEIRLQLAQPAIVHPLFWKRRRTFPALHRSAGRVSQILQRVFSSFLEERDGGHILVDGCIERRDSGAIHFRGSHLNESTYRFRSPARWTGGGSRSLNDVASGSGAAR